MSIRNKLDRRSSEMIQVSKTIALVFRNYVLLEMNDNSSGFSLSCI